MQLKERFRRHFVDPRDARYVTHDVATFLRQRVFQIVAGYEDVNDADRLRHDPSFQVVAGDGRAPLGSQPTLSRLENAIDWPAIRRLAGVGVDWFCAFAYGPDDHPADLVLDLDSTDDPTHGRQQLALFHGFYNQHMYHPLVWFEGRTGLLLRTRLRPGRDRSAARVVEELRHILPPLRVALLTRPSSCAATRGWRRPRSKRNWRRTGSDTCWASARITCSRPAWQDSSRRPRPGTSERTTRSRFAPASGIVRDPGRINAGSFGQDRRHGGGPQCPLHGHESRRARGRSGRLV
jgi:hypothetical protein